MTVIPIAGHDSMLLNLSGAHGPFFTRNLVILTDSDGNTGVGEVPGGEPIRRTLEDARAIVVGRSIGDYNAVLADMRRAFADRDAGGRGAQTFDLRVDGARRDRRRIGPARPARPASRACRWRRCSVTGSSATRVQALGYLFFVGDRTKTDLAYRSAADEDAGADEWMRVRHEEALTPERSSCGWPRRPASVTGSATSSSRAACCPPPTRPRPSSRSPIGSPTPESRWTPTAAGCSTTPSRRAAS